MSLGQWLVTLLITCIPCIGIVMLFVWAFGNGEYIEKKRWAQAQLIFTAIVIVLYFILYLAFGAAILGAMSGMG